jgi:hypothetical protein
MSAKRSAEPRPLKPGLELCGKYPVGRDPRRIIPDELKEMGHEPMSPLQAIRAHCLDCCVYQEKEVAFCTAVKCPSWPFRMGTDPWRKPASEARREAARRAITSLNARRGKRGGAGSSASPPEHGIAPSLAEGSGVAPVWATARVDHPPEADQGRLGTQGSGEGGDQFGKRSIADDGDVIPDLDEPAEGSAT